MNALTEYIQYTLYPSLYERIDAAFPDLHFKRGREGWYSAYKLNGEPAKDKAYDKTVVTRKVPTRILENGGESLSLIDYQLTRMGYQKGAKGAELIEALRSLSAICGLELPSFDSEEYQKYKERQEQLERTLATMRRELFTSPSGYATLAYLRGRGYTDEDIKAMELGYCSSETASKVEGAPYGAGSTHVLAIPYRSGSSILGFKFRAIDENVKPKYKNTSGLPKKASLFGLTGLLLTGNGKKDRDITVVEGELDALHAQRVGVENIVAAAGGELSSEALQEAAKRGVKRVTILFDTEEASNTEGVAATDKKIEKAIRLVQSEGLEALVARLPADNGEKVDVDSYLRTHTKDELQHIIDRAESGSKYLFYELTDKTIKEQGGENPEEGISDKLLGDYKNKVIELINDTTLTSPVDRDAILTAFSRVTNGIGISKEAIQEEADRKKEIADAIKQKDETEKIALNALKLAKEGKVDESLALMRQGSEKASKISKESKYKDFLQIPTVDEVKRRLKERPEGILTKYEFSSGKKKERLRLKAGALTLVCGGTSHGKSVLLRNLALQAATNGDEGTVLYFSFEEDYESTVVELVNTYVNRTLTTPSKDFNNLTTITEYYRTDSTRYIRKEEVANFERKQAELIKDVIGAGKLRILDEDLYSGELVEAIEYLNSKLKVKAVFVDYVQLLYREGTSFQARNEQLKGIAKELRQLAKRLKLPIILAAQLSTAAKSPTEMDKEDVADSVDLAREADTAILIWNSLFTPIKGGSYEEKQIEESKRMELGKAGYLYMKLGKNRGGQAGIDGIFTFHGNTGVVETNYVEVEPEVKQLSLADSLGANEDEDLPY